MAEIEIGILDRQCLNRRLPDRATLTTEVNAWQGRRNRERRGIEWTFTRQDADTKMARHYVANLRVRVLVRILVRIQRAGRISPSV